MRKVSIIILANLILFAAAAAGIEKVEKEEMMNYEKFSRKAAELYKAQKYDDVIGLYEKALQQFPDKVYEITSVLTQLYMFKKEYEKCLDVFEYGLKKKAVYPIFPSAGYWQPLANNERFKKIVEENNRLRAEFTARTTPKFEALTPAAFSDQIKYPLFIVLHGWNECLPDIDKHWQTDMIRNSIILVFIQSSQVVSMQRFGWDDAAAARKDIKEIFEKIVDKYPVDTAKIIIGGFSQGGMTALGVAAANVIPTKGFFALSPGGPLPADFNVENLTKARQRGLRGTILIREQDKMIKEKMELEKILQQADFPYRYIISQDQRWYPADFAQQLDAAITDILEKGTAPAADDEK